jgi:hypothetical protein
MSKCGRRIRRVVVVVVHRSDVLLVNAWNCAATGCVCLAIFTVRAVNPILRKFIQAGRR